MCISDTGVGIPKDKIPLAFGKFQQFGRVDGAGEKGTGLGLAIAKGIVELHGGTITIESKVDKGTSFYITLPKFSTRHVFGETIDQDVSHAIKHKTPLSFIMLTIDHFAEIEKNIGRDKIVSLMDDMTEVIKGGMPGAAGQMHIRRWRRVGFRTKSAHRRPISPG